jgi:hypothetical protein
MDEVRRSVLNVQVVIETNGSEKDHERTLLWATQRIKSAHLYAREASVAVRVTGPHDRDLGFAGHGDRLSRASRDIIDDFFDDEDDEHQPANTT